MQDFTKASYSKNIYKSFQATIELIDASLRELEVNFKNTWKDYDNIRRKRAEIIEQVIAILKRNHIKTKPLAQSSNEEIMETLYNNLDRINKKDRKYIKDNINPIDEDYKKMHSYVKHMEELLMTLSKYQLKEQDSSDEVIIDINDYKKKNISSSINKNDLNELKVNSNINKNPTITQDLSSLVSYIKPKQIDDLDTGFETIEMPSNMAFVDIVKNIYGSSDYWYHIYTFSNNKEKIDDVCKFANIPLDIAVRSKKTLTNISFDFPHEITAFVLVSNDYKEENKRGS